jgi:addiction module RelE/StbE family toxin
MPRPPAKSAASKRTSLPLPFAYAKTFLKDWERLTHSGRYDMHRLKETMQLLIANTGPLPAEHKNHQVPDLRINGIAIEQHRDSDNTTALQLD